MSNGDENPQTQSLPKRIILCSDGTGNSGGKGRGTNVWRIFNAIDLNGHRWKQGKREQIAFHDDGVGTQDMVLLKVLGGALGLGLKRNIRQIYTFLAKNYRPGDQIYLFGFSRGAYTIRALAGLITQCGVIDSSRCDEKQLERKIKRAIGILRRGFQRGFVSTLRPAEEKASAQSGTEADTFRRENSVLHDKYAPDGIVKIQFIGVWDTVDAYGFPSDHVANFWHYCIYPYKFPDKKLSEHVEAASQALAIDDERHTFHPTLWDMRGENPDRIHQVWFPGAHSNVGGGYPKDGLALVSLDWMMTEASRCGLRFRDDVRANVRNTANAYDKVYNSRAGAAVYYRYKPRDIARLCAENGIGIPDIHASTFQSIRAGVEDYAPGNVPSDCRIVATTYDDNDDNRQESKLRELQSTVNKSSSGRLLSEVAGLVNIRRFFHYVLLGITVATLVAAWYVRDEAIPADSEPTESALGTIGMVIGSIPAGLFEFIIKPFLIHPYWLLGTLIGSLSTIWLVGRLAKSRMRRKFSDFWRATLTR